MPTTYKGLTVPLSTDLADGPAAFRDYTDSLGNSEAFVPIGTIVDTIRTVAPTNWLILDGATITNGQTLYPILWGIVPAGWHSGADLILPNAKGRFVVGLDSGGDATMDTIGETGGTKTLAVANLPSHSHGGTTSAVGDHVHGGVIVFTGTGGNFQANPGYNAGNTAPAGAHSHSIPAEGGGQPFLPPFIAFNKMMRAA